MAAAMIKGLIANGFESARIIAIEPSVEARARLSQEFSIQCVSDPIDDLSWQDSSLLVWAVKPQQMKAACDSIAHLCTNALHLSVAAGIPTSSIAKWLGTERIVRAMPNTPALIGLGQTGLFARPGVTFEERNQIEQIIKGTGRSIWLNDETLLDGVTAISGSGPAYVFYFLEALSEAGVELGLKPEDAKQLAIGTFIGASQLAQQSADSLLTLRERVTSKGGTTEAALTHMLNIDLGSKFKDAVKIAHKKAIQLGVNYGN